MLSHFVIYLSINHIPYKLGRFIRNLAVNQLLNRINSGFVFFFPFENCFICLTDMVFINRTILYLVRGKVLVAATQEGHSLVVGISIKFKRICVIVIEGFIDDIKCRQALLTVKSLIMSIVNLCQSQWLKTINFR